MGNRESAARCVDFQHSLLTLMNVAVIFLAARWLTPLPTASGRRRRFPIPHSRFRRMSIQNDRWITQMARDYRMIEPFEGRQVRSGVISYGVSSYGYDM